MLNLSWNGSSLYFVSFALVDPVISFMLYLCLCLCLLYSQPAYLTLAHVHKHATFPSLRLGGICWAGRIQTAIIQARESASSTTPEEGLLGRDNTVFSEPDCPHQSPSRSVTDYPVFGRNEREEGKH